MSKGVSTSKVMPCDCVSADQDRRYGKGNRLHNQQNGKNAGHHRCTVCSRSK